MWGYMAPSAIQMFWEISRHRSASRPFCLLTVPTTLNDPLEPPASASSPAQTHSSTYILSHTTRDFYPTFSQSTKLLSSSAAHPSTWCASRAAVAAPHIRTTQQNRSVSRPCYPSLSVPYPHADTDMLVRFSPVFIGLGMSNTYWRSLPSAVWTYDIKAHPRKTGGGNDADVPRREQLRRVGG